MKTFRLVLVLVLAACAAAAAVSVFGPLLEKRSEKSDELTALREENVEIERRISELRRKQSEFDNNPEYVELTARRENRIRTSETVFDFGAPPSGSGE